MRSEASIEKNKKWQKENYNKNRNERLAKAKKYRDENREKCKKISNECHFNVFFGGNRQKVLERDNFECQNCGMSQEQHMALFGTNLNIHHKDGEGRNSKNPNNDMDNLITLCVRCHATLENPVRKLTEEQVIEIKELLNKGEIGDGKIGKKFNVNKQTIRAIRIGRTWRNI